MSREELVRRIRGLRGEFAPRVTIRRALLGRGVEGESSAKVADAKNKMWVRNREDPSQVYQVPADSIPDWPGLPVLIGVDELNPAQELIVKIDRLGLATMVGYSGSFGILGEHHEQHELHAYDMVNVSKGMVVPLRVRPTVPESWSVLVEADAAFYIGGELFSFGTGTPGYEATPIPGVRFSFGTGTPADSRWYLLAMDREADLYAITGSPAAADVPAGGFFTEATYGVAVKPSISLVGEGYPLAYVQVRANADGITFLDVDDVRPLWTFPAPQLPPPTAPGQILYTIDGTTFIPATPLVGADGNILVGADATILISG